MNQRKKITRSKLEQWLLNIMKQGTTVHGPVRQEKGTEFQPIRDISEITWDYIQTVQSPKYLLFPRTEELFRFRQKEGLPHIEESPEQFSSVLLFGSRPCDASAMLSLEAIFHWDSFDPLIKRRRDNMTVMSVSCTRADDFCFCTSVRCGPGNTAGSDILLTPSGENEWIVEILTPKGKEILECLNEPLEDAGESDRPLLLAQVNPVIQDIDPVVSAFQNLFDREEVWTEQSLRCLGCGACAYVCPACACFDIQDEGSRRKGKRLRCWDSCGFSLFTLHTSGHNPRHRQWERWRQRLMHKFSYMPQRLSVLGCVGCGRCSRACPVDMDLGEHLRRIEELSK